MEKKDRIPEVMEDLMAKMKLLLPSGVFMDILPYASADLPTAARVEACHIFGSPKKLGGRYGDEQSAKLVQILEARLLEAKARAAGIQREMESKAIRARSPGADARIARRTAEPDILGVEAVGGFRVLARGEFTPHVARVISD